MDNEEFQKLMLNGFKEMNKRFELIDKRFELIDKRFDKVDERFELIDRRFDKVEAKLNEHDVQFIEIKGELADLKALSSQHHNELENVARQVQKSLQAMEKLAEIDNEHLAKRSLVIKEMNKNFPRRPKDVISMTKQST